MSNEREAHGQRCEPDDEEWVDVYDEDGRMLGEVRRHDAHRLGLWHRTFHGWVVRCADDGWRVVVQRRHAAKERHPGRLDVSVAGHLRAGETWRDGVREFAEELGLVVRPDDLTYLGEFRHVDADGANWCDREIWTVFLYVLPAADPIVWRFHPREVAALYEARLPDLIALFCGDREMVEMTRLPHHGTPVCGGAQAHAGMPCATERNLRETARRDDFVPRPWSYYVTVLERMERARARLGVSLTACAGAAPKPKAPQHATSREPDGPERPEG
ncbi:hypothetical protein GCM10010885_17770 [Alicyclobacillus cellulosilyticus]|uniref:Nudix hydrolase domain-containing protein n=1 Tax=Alicyclobacillus cellulosilyticus TaxID=1003997 RepID=A0A917KCF8_9BACL|nr:NUDIX domain-containing protein [Alicyclobacillus cellulosilyticus]GGJ09140.1 hypothetical protein GCM10010885_17770 [Alicyclobacillus cellulosilyticus]